MVIEEELAAEFEVELAGEAGHPFEDGLLLFLKVMGVVESDGVVHALSLPFSAGIQRAVSLISLKSSNRP